MRRFALAAVVTLGGFGVAAACGDPYEGEIPTPAPERDASGASDAPIDASAVDAPPADAGADVEPCTDQDNDGFLPLGCDGGLDCDDLDDRARPDAAFVSDAPSLSTKGDWNCDGKIEKQYPVNVDCTKTSDCSVVGFKGDPPCGATGELVKCKLLLVNCTQDTVVQAVQGCR